MTEPAPIPDDDTEVGDDGGEHHFWAFVVALRARRAHPDFVDHLEDVDALEAAVHEFEATR